MATLRFPKDAATVKIVGRERRLVATGRAGEGIGGILKAGNKAFFGKVFYPSPTDRKAFAMVFKRVDPAEYTLEVFRGNGKRFGNIIVTVTAGGHAAPIITYPDPHSNNPSDSFVAYGLRDEPIISATLQLGTSAAVLAEFIYDDPDTGFWCAQFPATLTPGNGYTLTITDADEDSTPITVNVV